MLSSEAAFGPHFYTKFNDEIKNIQEHKKFFPKFLKFMLSEIANKLYWGTSSE